jgi:hypothetical protein
MGIVAAIARVRAGAKSAGIEGALNTLGAELKSDAIPERLRDVAGRLAALLGASNSNIAATQPVVPSLEVALEQHAQLRATAPADAVCPFTGLRADEMGVEHNAAAARMETEGLSTAAAATVDTAPARAASESELAPIQEEASAPEPSRAAVVAEASEEPAAKSPAANAVAAEPDAAATVDAASDAKEKHKEKLAGARSVENTSARSANRPAAKRPRGRANGSRKKT